MDNTDSPPERKRNGRTGKAPAFQFYPADWLADARVRSMTREERGVYIDLLAYCWREGSIPTTIPELARLLVATEEETARWWERIGPRFSPDGTHRRLEAERRKQGEFSRLQRARIMKRWNTESHNHAPVNNISVQSGINPVVPDGYSASASASASAEGGGAGVPLRDGDLPLSDTLPAKAGRRARKGPFGEPEAFARFYAAYPRKVDRALALAAWKAINPSDELAEKIIAAIEPWKKSQEWVDGKIVYPVRFLRYRRWESIPAPAAPPASPRLTAEEESWQREKARFLAGFKGEKL